MEFEGDELFQGAADVTSDSEPSEPHLVDSSDEDEVTGPLEVDEERDSLASLPSSLRNGTPAGPIGIKNPSTNTSTVPTRFSGFRDNAAADTSHLMGSSLPIRIPQNSFRGAQSLMTGMARLQKQQPGAPGFLGGNATHPPGGPLAPEGPVPLPLEESEAFVPPHLLNPYNQGDEGAYNIMSVIEGTTPGARMKKELLKQRNRIMKATGFLESELERKNAAALQGTPMGIPMQAGPRTPGALSGLLAAKGGIPSSLPKSSTLFEDDTPGPGL